MALLRKILSNEALTLIIAIFIFALIYFAWSRDTATFFKGVGVCAALWGGVGIASLGFMLEEKKYPAGLNFLDAVILLVAAAVLGPFALNKLRYD